MIWANENHRTVLGGDMPSGNPVHMQFIDVEEVEK